MARNLARRRKVVAKAVRKLRERRRALKVCRDHKDRPIFKGDRCRECYDANQATKVKKSSAPIAAADTSPEQPNAEEVQRAAEP